MQFLVFVLLLAVIAVMLAGAIATLINVIRGRQQLENVRLGWSRHSLTITTLLQSLNDELDHLQEENEAVNQASSKLAVINELPAVADVTANADQFRDALCAILPVYHQRLHAARECVKRRLERLSEIQNSSGALAQTVASLAETIDTLPRWCVQKLPPQAVETIIWTHLRLEYVAQGLQEYQLQCEA